MGAGWLVAPRPDGRRTRVSSFVCDMRVLFADPVSRCPGIGIWFPALQLVLALLGEKSNGYSVSKCKEWGEMTIVFFSLSRSTRLLKCLVVRSGSGGRDNEGQRLALAIDVFLPGARRSLAMPLAQPIALPGTPGRAVRQSPAMPMKPFPDQRPPNQSMQFPSQRSGNRIPSSTLSASWIACVNHHGRSFGAVSVEGSRRMGS